MTASSAENGGADTSSAGSSADSGLSPAGVRSTRATALWCPPLRGRSRSETGYAGSTSATSRGGGGTQGTAHACCSPHRRAGGVVGDGKYSADSAHRGLSASASMLSLTRDRFRPTPSCRPRRDATAAPAPLPPASARTSRRMVASCSVRLRVRPSAVRRSDCARASRAREAHTSSSTASTRTCVGLGVRDVRVTLGRDRRNRIRALAAVRIPHPRTSSSQMRI